MRVAGRVGAAVAIALTAGTASAATIDFTNMATFESFSGGIATGMVNGISFRVTSSSGALTFNDGSGPGPIAGLAGDGDGIGIGDDEVGESEYLIVEFDRAVRLTGVAFLDLFRSREAAETESVSVYAGTPPMGANFLASLDASELFQPGGAGYAFLGLSQSGTTFSFDSGTGNDGFGIGDFALAGLEVQLAAVPLPASAALLGAGLLGFGFLRRKS